MEFLYVNFLWALLAVLIPIIIHLFYFKRFKKVYFSNTKFLKEIKEETTNKNKIKNLLVLLSRILAIAFLVFAFAQPYIPVGEKIKKGTIGVSIYVDNSFSMQTMSEDVPLIDKAKQTATQIVKGFPEDAQFQIITNKLYGNEQKWINRQNAIEKISLIKLSPLVKKIDVINKRQKQSLGNNSNDNKYIYWITDLQKPIFNIDTSVIDTMIEYNIIALQPIRERNISIDSCYWESPVPILNQVNKLLVKVTNYSNEDIDDIPINIQYNGQTYPSGKIKLKKGSSKIDTIDFRIKSTGWNQAKISIKDYPVVFDDEYYIAFNVPKKISIVNINEKTSANENLKAVFNSNNIFEFTQNNINHIDYSNIKNNKLIILEDIRIISSGLKNTLIEAIKSGSNLLVFPNKDADIKSFNSFLSSVNANIIKEFKKENSEANNLNQNEFVFTDVYDKISRNITPITVKGSFIMSKFQTKNSYQIISFKNGDSFITRYQYGKGNIYLCASPFDLEYNDLARNPDIFIPMIFKMSIFSNNNSKLALTIGKDRSIELNNINTNDKGLLYIKGNDTEFIPKQINSGSGLKLDYDDQIINSGLYTIEKNNDIIKKTAFNFDRTESNLSYFDQKYVSDKFNDRIIFYDNTKGKKDYTELINSKQKGIELWKWAILLALLFLAIETLLLRFWKNK